MTGARATTSGVNMDKSPRMTMLKYMEQPKAEKKPRRIKPTGRLYKQLKDDLVYGYVPRIYPCYHCGGPVMDGYCCGRCGSSDPQGWEEKYKKTPSSKG